MFLLLILACGQGNGPGNAGSDDTDSSSSSSSTGFSAEIVIEIPEAYSEMDIKVSVDGAAVESCDRLARQPPDTCSFTASEPGTYEVTASADALYFAPLTAEVAEADNGKSVSISWTEGGCSDTEWSVGDGFCEDENSDLWVNGQVACDFSGSWEGIEDQYWDWEAELEMVDGDGVDEVGIEGDNSPFDEFTNASGTKFYEVTEAGGLVSGQLVKIEGDEYVPAQSCEDFDAVQISLVTIDGDLVEWHIRQ